MSDHSLGKRKKSKKKVLKPGPLYSKDGIPYDYIVIIDAGSKGSRLHVYNYLNAYQSMKKGIDLSQYQSIKKRNKLEDELSDDESESDDDNPKKLPNLFPKIQTKSKWHKKIIPGVSSFNKAPHKIGKHHLAKLLSRASKIVPQPVQYRTPIFLYATGGMRLLIPTEQKEILKEICKFFENQSDFFFPDCASHVSVIDGDYEGIYGWLSINTLIGAFDDPNSHQHGKNHTTYGLLDMGGASTQVVFQPNITEIDEHQNNLYHIKLRQVPQLNNSNYEIPNLQEYNVYSDSFLGFGMFQARNRYLKALVENDDKDEQYHYWGFTKSPIPDPCIPKGFTTSTLIDDHSYDFIGESNFEKCLKNIFPVLQNSTHGGGPKAKNCKQFSDGDEVSECLLNELIPSFDFDINHFIGVSGYWDAIEDLLSQEDKRQIDSRDLKDQKNTYDYKKIFNKTQKVCSQSWSSMLELNKQKEYKNQLTEDELSELCFKSSWILNFLHLGLGFPRFGIDEPNNKDFQTLQLVETLDGSSFSWALGKAVLYANDEYIQAFNNLTNNSIQRPGFYHSTSENIYQYGAEQNNIESRPLFDESKMDESHYYNYELKDETDNESIWNIEPHRWYGLIIFVVLLGFIGYLMLGGRNRALFITKIKTGFRKIYRLTPGYNEAKYTTIAGDFELGDMPEVDSQFKVDDDDEEDDENVNDNEEANDSKSTIKNSSHK
ncbi:uncharacterized protein KGF55_004237 [Candida pseudojiufengensis]|uniref:uncharacterized protein n=1 Tax=Candida pseudojiufengensis TaxID=497109 RepID=UPI0022246456|nr:uncharacterized protein KGF55_004237 [Candida pseudojiufengensis]KAI5960970.1 hypothetical protein KGF55_004237 [Candida pseudojiufengensis]